MTKYTVRFHQFNPDTGRPDEAAFPDDGELKFSAPPLLPQEKESVRIKIRADEIVDFVVLSRHFNMGRDGVDVVLVVDKASQEIMERRVP